jgi:hypothetical protein
LAGASSEVLDQIYTNEPSGAGTLGNQSFEHPVGQLGLVALGIGDRPPIRWGPPRDQGRLSQLDRLAMSEKVNVGRWCQLSDAVGERGRREVDQTSALREADGPPGPPMHRNGVFRLNTADRPCRLLGVEMTLTMARDNAGSPASNWHQGYVDLLHRLQRKLWTRVPRIPPSARAINEAERRSAMRASCVSSTVVISGQDTYLQTGELHKVTWLDLPEPQPAVRERLKQAARACWGNDNRRGWDQSKRRKVGVVEMQVGDQDDVRMGRVFGRNLTPDSTEMAHPSGQNWVEQEGCAVIVPSSSAVPPPCQGAGHSAP